MWKRVSMFACINCKWYPFPKKNDEDKKGISCPLDNCDFEPRK